jgi:hypothetical protein
MKRVMVRYRVKPDRVGENEVLVRDVSSRCHHQRSMASSAQTRTPSGCSAPQAVASCWTILSPRPPRRPRAAEFRPIGFGPGSWTERISRSELAVARTSIVSRSEQPECRTALVNELTGDQLGIVANRGDAVDAVERRADEAGSMPIARQRQQQVWVLTIAHVLSPTRRGSGESQPRQMGARTG